MCVWYYKVWQIVITKCIRYYKVSQVLQCVTKVNDKVRPLLHSATGSTKHDRDTLLWQSASVITKFKSYYRVRCNILQNLPLCFFVLYFFFFFVKLLCSTFSSNFMLSSREVLSTVFVHYYFGSFGL